MQSTPKPHHHNTPLRPVLLGSNPADDLSEVLRGIELGPLPQPQLCSPELVRKMGSPAVDCAQPDDKLLKVDGIDRKGEALTIKAKVMHLM